MPTTQTPSDTPHGGPEQDALPAGITVGTLYVVATPIGNLSDLGQRAGTTLQQVKWVAAEDTRVSRVLLDRIGCRPTLIPMHEHNEHRIGDELVARLAAGESGAVISDAGTPAISDPGARLVARAHQAGIRVVPVPGPSAPVTLLSAAGLAPGPFLFEGFLPTKARARDDRLRRLRTGADALGAHLVLFEAPHRIDKTLQALAQVYGPDRTIVIGRELTKLFEEIHRGTTGQALAWRQARDERLRGEFVLAIAAPAQTQELADDGQPALAQQDGAGTDPLTALAGGSLMPSPGDLLTRLLQDLPPSRAVRLAQDLTGAPHRELYALALALKPGQSDAPDEVEQADQTNQETGTGN